MSNDYNDFNKRTIGFMRKSAKVEEIQELYETGCKILGIGDVKLHLKPLKPYNLLITSHWIYIIKRRIDSFRGYNINALGFAGYLIQTEESNTKWLNFNGPDKLLLEVT